MPDLMSRRTAVGSIVRPTLGAAAASLMPLMTARAADVMSAAAADPRDPADFARDEDFWGEVSRAFTMDRSIINLNNGGCSPSPDLVQQAMKRHLDYANSNPPPWALWTIQEPRKETTRARLARQWGVDPEEIAITRNASESLQTCQFGLALSRGDEVLTTTQDYPRMLTTFEQRERREGIVLKQITIPTPCEDDDEIVRRFEAAITERTRMILVSHMVFLTGQVLPVRRVCELGRRRNIPVIVDSAHAFAHIDFKISDLNCDYLGTSLHKWLFAPHGTGLLYVRRERIEPLWPLMAAEKKLASDIRKFEEIGTHPAANHLAIAEALTFHQSITGPRKEARMRALRDRWATRLIDAGGGRVRLFTSLDPRFSCGLTTFGIDGIEPAKLCSWLWETCRIFNVWVELKGELKGLRITPSVYTTFEELDRFCEKVEWAMKHGVPT